MAIAGVGHARCHRPGARGGVEQLRRRQRAVDLASADHEHGPIRQQRRRVPDASLAHRRGSRPGPVVRVIELGGGQVPGARIGQEDGPVPAAHHEHAAIVEEGRRSMLASLDERSRRRPGAYCLGCAADRREQGRCHGQRTSAKSGPRLAASSRVAGQAREAQRHRRAGFEDRGLGVPVLEAEDRGHDEPDAEAHRVEGGDDEDGACSRETPFAQGAVQEGSNNPRDREQPPGPADVERCAEQDANHAPAARVSGIERDLIAGVHTSAECRRPPDKLHPRSGVGVNARYEQPRTAAVASHELSRSRRRTARAVQG